MMTDFFSFKSLSTSVWELFTIVSWFSIVFSTFV